MDRIETVVGDLIVALECYDLDARIRLASQPGWPFEYTIGGIALTPDDADDTGTAPTDEPVVWMGRAVRSATCPAPPATRWDAPGARRAIRSRRAGRERRPPGP